MAGKGKEQEEIQDLLNMKLENLEQLDILDDDVQEPEPKEEKIAPAESRKKNTQLQKMAPNRMAALPEVRDVERKFEKEVEQKPDGTPLKEKIKQINFSDRSEEYLENTMLTYEAAVDLTRDLYHNLIKEHRYSNKKIRKMIKSFIDVLMEDQCILVNFSSFDHKPDDYLFHHALNTCLLSINIATILGYSEDQIIEIGEAGLLCDVGMMLTPLEIRQKNGPLDSNEHFEILKHPIVGVYFIEKILGIPDRVSYVSYQHHERLSGDGYPRKREGRIIHNFSKIIAVADVYEAMTSSRPYRESKHPFDAILDLMKMAKQGQLEMDIIKAILPVTSVYPVGCLVKLSNNCIAKVVKSNGAAALTQPVVTVVTDEDGGLLQRDEMYQIDLFKQKKEFDIINTIHFKDLKDLNSLAGF